MSYKLFLDDRRTPERTEPYSKKPPHSNFWDDIKIARTYDDAVEIINEFGAPYMLMLDYFLGDDHFLGIDVVEYFVEYIMEDQSRLPDNFHYHCHTNSDTGARKMSEKLEDMLNKIYG
jgi:hypothetical protein